MRRYCFQKCEGDFIRNFAGHSWPFKNLEASYPGWCSWVFLVPPSKCRHSTSN